MACYLEPDWLYGAWLRSKNVVHSTDLAQNDPYDPHHSRSKLGNIVQTDCTIMLFEERGAELKIACSRHVMHKAAPTIIKSISQTFD